jgi:hypothetical protein
LSHYEISPREREDEEAWHEAEFGTVEMAAEDEADRIRRMSEPGPQESDG